MLDFRCKGVQGIAVDDQPLIRGSRLRDVQVLEEANTKKNILILSNCSKVGRNLYSSSLLDYGKHPGL